jgi:hypothetical protein
MDAPRILAINDVHFRSSPETMDRVVDFYTGTIGLDQVESEREGVTVFRGYPRSGPRLVVDATLEEPDSERGRIHILVASLTECMDQLAERRVPVFLLRGWMPYERRVMAFDPAGNRVELVTSHPF